MTLQDLGWDDAWASRLPRDAAPGRVAAVHGSLAAVATGDDATLLCPLRRLGAPPAVGDWVALDAAGAVTAVLPRRSALEREGGVLAANVDVVLLAVACDRPDARRLERFAALAGGAGTLVLVVTKADAGDPAAVLAEARTAVPEAPAVVCSARTGEGLEAVRAWLPAGRTGVLVGRSGAGKSSLVNALLGHEAQAVAEVRARDAEGRHTTTRRELLPLPGGGCLVDMPGLKLPRMAASATPAPDVAELAAGCRFADCTHDSEPGCAVRGAVDPDELERWRVLEGERARAVARDDERRRAGRRGSRTVREALRADER